MSQKNWFLSFFYLLIVIFLFFPILIVMPISFLNGRFLSWPPGEFGLRWYINDFSDPVSMDATFRSLRVALGASL